MLEEMFGKCWEKKLGKMLGNVEMLGKKVVGFPKKVDGFAKKKLMDLPKKVDGFTKKS